MWLEYPKVIASTRRQRVLSLVTIALLTLSACDRPQTSSAPAIEPTPGGTPLAQADIKAWIHFRLVYGLRADPGWVADVATDPSAIVNLGAPLLPFEAQAVLDAQASADRLVESARRYGNHYQLEFVGVWIEGPVVVLGFRDNIADRRAEVEALFGNRVTVREAKYSRFQLEGFVRAIDRERGPNARACTSILVGPPEEPVYCRKDAIDWFDTIGFEFGFVGIDELANVVYLRYRAPTQAAEALIREHFDAGDWLRLEWEGPIRDDTED